MPSPSRHEVLKKVETVVVTKNSVITKQDGSDSKASLNTINSDVLELGTIAPGETSQTKIMFLRVPSGLGINNIKIGLIDSGGINFSNTTFGVETRSYLDYNIIPNTYFEGINTDKTANSPYNISIANNGALASQYVYLNVIVPNNHIFAGGTIRFKWFFSYVSGV